MSFAGPVPVPGWNNLGNRSYFLLVLQPSNFRNNQQFKCLALLGLPGPRHTPAHPTEQIHLYVSPTSLPKIVHVHVSRDIC